MARRPEFNREDVVNRAMCVFLKQGYEAASVDDLTRELDISRASLYNTFGDKRGLLLAAMGCAEKTGEQLREGMLEAPGAPAVVVKKFFERLVSLHLAGDATPGCLFLTVGAELGDLDAEVAARVTENLTRHRRAFESLLERATGWSEAKRRERAAALVGAMVSLLILVRVYADPAVLNAIIRQAAEMLRE